MRVCHLTSDLFHMQHLAGLAEAAPPRAGMFQWLRLMGVRDSGSLRALFKEEKVVVVPGAGRVQGESW